MDSLELMKVLIQKLEVYDGEEQDKTNLSLAGFCHSVKTELDYTDLKNNLIREKENSDSNSSKAHYIESNIERVIAQHILFLYRYIKFYSKLAFEESVIKSIEEFGFLITVLQEEACTKSELIKKNIIEKSSGIEMINRLIKSGLLIQKDNPGDQRSQLILLTETGKTALFKIFDKMNTLGIIATGKLNNFEKDQLVHLLKKLDNFHYEKYNNKSLKKLEDFLPNI